MSESQSVGYAWKDLHEDRFEVPTAKIQATWTTILLLLVWTQLLLHYILLPSNNYEEMTGTKRNIGAGCVMIHSP